MSCFLRFHICSTIHFFTDAMGSCLELLSHPLSLVLMFIYMCVCVCIFLFLFLWPSQTQRARQSLWVLRSSSSLFFPILHNFSSSPRYILFLSLFPLSLLRSTYNVPRASVSISLYSDSLAESPEKLLLDSSDSLFFIVPNASSHSNFAIFLCLYTSPKGES